MNKSEQLNAQQARQYREVCILEQIYKEIKIQCLKGDNQLYYDLDHSIQDNEILYITNKLSELGYEVSYNKAPPNIKQSAYLTIKW